MPSAQPDARLRRIVADGTLAPPHQPGIALMRFRRSLEIGAFAVAVPAAPALADALPG
jgi:hypothetical protein